MTDERAKVLAALVKNPAELREYFEQHDDLDTLPAVVMLLMAVDLARERQWQMALDTAKQAIVVMEAQA